MDDGFRDVHADVPQCSAGRSGSIIAISIGNMGRGLSIASSGRMDISRVGLGNWEFDLCVFAIKAGLADCNPYAFGAGRNRHCSHHILLYV